MAELWGLPEVNEWWLPDGGFCSPVVRSIRSFMETRLPHAEGESRSEDQRNIKGIFSQLSLHESPKAGSTQACGFGTPTFIESRSLSAEDLASQGRTVHTADEDVDQDMGVNTTTLGQSRESFYKMGV